MLTEIGGLPAHVLLIHLIVVLAPLGALFTVLSAVWPAARRKLGPISPLTCLIVLVLTPVTANAGEWLEERLTSQRPDGQIEKHADLGDTFLWFAIGLFVFSAAVWWLGRLEDRTDASATPDVTGTGGSTVVATRTAVPVAVRYAVAAISVLVSIATMVQLYRIGDSGASATWDYVTDLK